MSDFRSLLTSSKLRTNFDRTIILGPQPKSFPEPAHTLIDLPNQKGSRLFFEHSPLGVRNLSFETPEPQPTPESLILPQSLSPHPGATFFESYFYSTVHLAGVCRIVPCQRYIHGRQHITGLYLHFPEGHQSCVGHVRLDSLANPIQMGARQRKIAVNCQPCRLRRFCIELDNRISQLSRSFHS